MPINQEFLGAVLLFMVGTVFAFMWGRRRGEDPEKVLQQKLLKVTTKKVVKHLEKNDYVTVEGMEKVGDQPCLILMNHCSFMDMEMAEYMLFPKPVGIVCTSDAFIGKDFLMRWIGCFPTKKFVSDPHLISDIRYCLEERKMNVLMYPEACYSFDGTASALPRRLGVLLKRLGVPVVMIQTYGAFSRQPLYNCLRKREVPVSAKMYCLLTKEEIKSKSVEELDRVIDEAFSFDYFRWQQEKKVRIADPERAEGLERILYKCPHCGAEGKTVGKGVTLTCTACKKVYELDEYGWLKTQGEAKFDHIPAWFAWQREEVKKELQEGTYRLDTAVEIYMLRDHKAIYNVGSGRMIHDETGFQLTGCDGRLNYTQSPLASHSLYADYFWHEQGDIIGVGNQECLYYCFPEEGIPVVKARLAAEELYKLKKSK